VLDAKAFLQQLAERYAQMAASTITATSAGLSVTA